MADFTVSNDILVDFDSHIHNGDNGLYKDIENQCTVISGKVGIGTTAPANLLTVQGSFNATSSSTQMLLNSNGDVTINLKG